MSSVAASIPADVRIDESDNLLERFRAGDEAAFARVVALHHRQVAGTVRRLMGWCGDCEDVVQEVFLTALRKRSSFRGDCEIASWLTAIAIRQCRAERRRWWKRLLHRDETIDEVAAKERTIDDSAEYVRAAVRKLPAKDREVIVLYYLEQRTGEEVAQLIGISPGAVDVRLHRARKKLGELLKGLM